MFGRLREFEETEQSVVSFEGKIPFDPNIMILLISMIVEKEELSMNGSKTIEEILSETVESEEACSSNVHSQTWHDSWRDSH